MSSCENGQATLKRGGPRCSSREKVRVLIDL